MLKAHICLLKVRSHLIKFVRKQFDLVTGLDIEARAKVALADEFHSITERFERTNHSPANQKSSQQCHAEPNEEQNRSARQRSIDRLIHFLDWPLNEYSPV